MHAFISSSSSSSSSFVIVNSRFLERPQKRSRGNQLIHRRLTETKSIGSGQDPESQAGRQLDGYGGWCLELRREGRYGDDDMNDIRMQETSYWKGGETQEGGTIPNRDAHHRESTSSSMS